MTRFPASLAPLFVLLLFAAPLAAQATPPLDTTAVADTSDSIFVHAQRMAAEGQGDAARALVQHEIDISPAGSPHYVDALYWRAVVASTAADAERDLRRIIIEYPLSPRNEDALLRLAQLEMTRGDNDQALAHLQRLVIDHPTSPSRARASFWMARVYFDKNQTPAACRSLADAAHNTTAAQVEQRNQIDFWMQRCHGTDTSAVASTATDTAPPGTSPGATASASAMQAAPPARSPAPATPTTTTRSTTPVKSSTTSTRAGAGPSSGKYTVQVGAYPTHASAESHRKALAARGIDARVVGTSAPYRVRIGRYGSRAEADAAAQRLKAKKLSVYVTEAEPQ
ncbi:MAG TPA: SPOR domain-containing protein [Gemmatimonadaceae bacterium]|jgi:cell division protein FtsN